MTAIRYITVLFISLMALSIQTAHASKETQPKTTWMSMSLSHTLASSLSTSARQEILLPNIKSLPNAAFNNRYIATLLLDNNNQSIQAASIDNKHQRQSWLTIKHDSELISNIPAPTTDTLLDQSQQLLSILKAKQATISQTVEDTTFDTKDALISIIMPGGLLYASHRKFSHTQAKEELTQIINERNEITMDIVLLQTISLAMLD